MTPKDIPEAPAAAAPERAPIYAGLRNSLWCTDKSGRLGMIAEMTSASALFYYERTDGKGLEATGTMVPIEELKQCSAFEVPTRCGFNAAQLTEAGYK